MTTTATKTSTSPPTPATAKEPVRVRLSTFDRPRIPAARPSYDAAAGGRLHDNHWAGANDYDAAATIRQDLPTLRKRARYEVRNNTYAKGIIETHANDIVGPGPRLQIETDDREYNREIENRFADWAMAAEVGGQMSLADILRLAVHQLHESGESVIVETNDLTAETDILYRLQVIEPDRLTTPWKMLAAAKVRDGIGYNAAGRPEEYYILKTHPGDTKISAVLGAYETVPAASVVHTFRTDRPGQTRGVPWLTPALPLFAHLRRYTLAVITAAEFIANPAGTIQTNSSDIDVDAIESLDEFEIPRGSLLTLPEGYELSQIKAEQPSTTYKDFKAAILNEIGRCLNMPYNVVAANSSGYNYASGRLDWQVYFRSIRVHQAWLGRAVCNRALAGYIAEAALVSPWFKPAWRKYVAGPMPSAWYWPGHAHIDPVKEAAAQRLRLANGTTTLANEYSLQGRDWERELEQIHRERQRLAELGLSLEYATPRTADAIAQADKDADEDEKDKDDD